MAGYYKIKPLSEIKPYEVFRYKRAWYQREGTGSYSRKMQDDRASYNFGGKIIVATLAPVKDILDAEPEDDGSLPF